MQRWPPGVVTASTVLLGIGAGGRCRATATVSVAGRVAAQTEDGRLADGSASPAALDLDDCALRRGQEVRQGSEYLQDLNL